MSEHQPTGQHVRLMTSSEWSTVPAPGTRVLLTGAAGGLGRALSAALSEAGAEVVVVRGDEDLTLAGQAPPGSRVLHPVEIALEAQPVRVGVLPDPPVPGADRAGRPRRQHCGEVGLALLPPAEPPADEGIGVAVGALHGDALLDDHRIHEARVPGRCDGYADAAGPPVPRAACAAASLASGTRYGEHET